MDHSTVTMIGPEDWISSFGKETSDTSFSVRAMKKDHRIVTILSPSRYPEKIWSLLFSLSLSDRVLMNVSSIDRELGETIIAMDLLKKERGMIHVSEMVDRTQFENLVRDTVIEKWEVMDPDPATLREKIFELSNKWPGEPPSVIVDQAFPVKGVGTVALGLVISGTITKHHSLVTCPGEKSTQVRSIQIHDRDHTKAPAGARVGMAMKNIDPEDLPRGTLLSEEASGAREMDRLELTMEISPFWKGSMEEGSHLHLWSSLQFVPATVEEIVKETSDGKGRRMVQLVLSPESPVWAMGSTRFGLVYLDSKTFRLFAAGEII